MIINTKLYIKSFREEMIRPIYAGAKRKTIASSSSVSAAFSPKKVTHLVNVSVTHDPYKTFGYTKVTTIIVV